MAVVRTLILVAFLVFGPVSGTVVAENFFTSENYLKGKFAFDEGDYEIAVKLWMDSAKQGQPEAQGFIGAMYHAGYGVEKDYGKAMKWYLKAAYGGHLEVHNFIGDLYYDSKGVPKDDIAAYAWWLVGVNIGDEAPLNNLEFLGRQLTPEQQAKARKLAKKLEGEMADAQKNR